MPLELEDRDKIDWRNVQRTALRAVRRSPGVVAVNLVPLFGVLFLGWKAAGLYLLFWLETLLVIFIDVARMQLVRGLGWGKRADRALEAVIYVAIAVAMCFGQLLFIILLLARKEWEALPKTPDPFRDLFAFIDSYGIWYSFGIIAVLHIADWIRVSLGHRERGELDSTDGPLASMLRIAALQVALLLIFLPAALFGAPALTLVVLIIVKIALEIAMREWLGGTVTSTFTGWP